MLSRNYPSAGSGGVAIVAVTRHNSSVNFLLRDACFHEIIDLMNDTPESDISRDTSRDTSCDTSHDEIALKASRLLDIHNQEMEAHNRNDLALVVNSQRQAVYANDAFLKFADQHEHGAQFFGQRPGELFNCVHIEEGECGTLEHCQFCGTANAILATQNSGARAQNECVIRSYSSGFPVTYNFVVSSIPFAVDGSQYIMLYFRDIGPEKHKAALERIFFHDILNTVSGLQSYIDLLKKSSGPKTAGNLVDRLGNIAESLVEEIQSQKLIASAENRTLKTNRHFIASIELLERIIEQYESHPIAQGKRFSLADSAESFSFVSDDAILRRIIQAVPQLGVCE